MGPVVTLLKPRKRKRSLRRDRERERGPHGIGEAAVSSGRGGGAVVAAGCGGAPASGPRMRCSASGCIGAGGRARPGGHRRQSASLMRTERTAEAADFVAGGHGQVSVSHVVAWHDADQSSGGAGPGAGARQGVNCCSFRRLG
jgi:hypothetical protein